MIRRAYKRDFESVYQMINTLEACEFSKDKFMCVFEEIMSSKHCIIFLFEQDHEVLGMLHLRMENQLHHCDKIAEIMELIVHEGYRSEGIGKQLLSAACNYAKSCSCIQIEVTSNCKRKNAHCFYLKNDMQQTHYKFTKSLEIS